MLERRHRVVRFVRAQVDPLPDGRRQALVQVERAEFGVSTGTAVSGSEQGEVLRAVARAAADAVSESCGEENVAVRVRGIQVVEAFGQAVVIASLAATHGVRTQMLLGISDGTSDPVRATALAVLNGTNRFLGSG